MNNYGIEIRKVGHALPACKYNIIAESLEDAITRAKTEIPNDFGKEYRYEFISARETACNVLLPETKAAAGSRK